MQAVNCTLDDYACEGLFIEYSDKLKRIKKLYSVLKT